MGCEESECGENMTAVRGSVLCIFSRRCGGMSRVVTWRCDLSGQAEVRKLAKPDPPSCGHVVRGRKGQWGRSRTDRAKPELQTEVDWYPVQLIDRASWLDVHAREPSGQQACAEPRITRALRICQAGLTRAAYQKPPSWMSRRYYRLLLGVRRFVRWHGCVAVCAGRCWHRALEPR